MRGERRGAHVSPCAFRETMIYSKAILEERMCEPIDTSTPFGRLWDFYEEEMSEIAPIGTEVKQGDWDSLQAAIESAWSSRLWYESILEADIKLLRDPPKTTVRIHFARLWFKIRSKLNLAPADSPIRKCHPVNDICCSSHQGDFSFWRYYESG